MHLLESSGKGKMGVISESKHEASSPSEFRPSTNSQDISKLIEAYQMEALMPTSKSIPESNSPRSSQLSPKRVASPKVKTISIKELEEARLTYEESNRLSGLSSSKKSETVKVTAMTAEKETKSKQYNPLPPVELNRERSPQFG